MKIDPNASAGTLTARAMLAANAMNGLLAANNPASLGYLAMRACECADALIDALNEGEAEEDAYENEAADRVAAQLIANEPPEPVERLSVDLDRVREERDRLRPASDKVRKAAVSVADQVVQIRNELGEVIRRLDEQQMQIDEILALLTEEVPRG